MSLLSRAGLLLSSVAAAATLRPVPVQACRPAPMDLGFSHVIQQVVAMPQDGELQSRVGRHGLQVVNVMWEDTGRHEGSAVGPNISDLTLQVREQTPHGLRTHLLPVIRHPNFSDVTGDVPADKLWVRVGNQVPGGKPTAVPLTEVLRNLREYLSNPTSLQGTGNLLSERDSHFLVSAQHVFLPVPRSGKVEFNPVLFNYQSMPGSPAVLTLLVTRQGLSATVIENRPGDQSLQGWGQQLFFNHGGQKTAFTAERKSDVAARIGSGQATDQDEGALESGADMMMIVQVPLKHRAPAWFSDDVEGMSAEMEAPAAGAPMAKAERRRGGSDVEQAVLGHGADQGPFEEMRGLKVERDERFPIRVTVQFYKATSNGVVSNEDLAEVSNSIRQVYANADYVGSLVVPQSARHRPTDWLKDRPAHTAWGIFSR
ncbi:MAG: hypothetical protein AB2A00_27930 [Myxococcota bacterium]